MIMSIISKPLTRSFLYIVALLISSRVLISQPMYFMACCSQLNCEGRYTTCVSNCASRYPGSQSCMDNCQSAADACAHTTCDIRCGANVPCWFAGDTCSDKLPISSGAACTSSLDCLSGFTCMDGTCQSGTTDACGSEGCAYPYVCVAGSCTLGGCVDDNQCAGTTALCSGGMCYKCYKDEDCGVQTGRRCEYGTCK